jgi:hypothetical protein
MFQGIAVEIKYKIVQPFLPTRKEESLMTDDWGENIVEYIPDRKLE